MANSKSEKKKKRKWDKQRTERLFREYKINGSEAAREELITSHMNLVRFLAYKFNNRGEPIEDLIQVGMVGLIKAIDRFDISRGLQFTTYATPTILGEIKRHFRDKGWSVRVPRRLQELSAKVNKAVETLTQDLQRVPTYDEIADYLDVTVDEVLEAMESSGAYSTIPLESGGKSGDDDDAPSIIDRFEDEDTDLLNIDNKLLLERALDEFPPTEQDAIRYRYIDGMTQVEIAEKLGISQVQVSRLLRKTLDKLQDKVDPRGYRAALLKEEEERMQKLEEDDS